MTEAAPSPSSSSLPSHPTAQAFFAALDGKNDSNKSSRRSSDFVRKQCQTLGWRNRHSQEEFYPLTVGDNHKFSVMQVQRGEVENTYGTGATVWPAAVVLVKYLEHLATVSESSSENLMRDKVVVDLGAGTGVSIDDLLVYK